MVTHRGGCHCGRVRYEFTAEPDLMVSECNCSVCGKSGYLGVTVPKERFRLLRGEAHLSEYTFNTGTARHRFCRHCGIKSLDRRTMPPPPGAFSRSASKRICEKAFVGPSVRLSSASRPVNTRPISHGKNSSRTVLSSLSWPFWR